MHTASMYLRSFLIALFMLLALPVAASQSTLLVLGDSLSAAYGVPTQTAWVQLLQNRLQKKNPGWQVVNASISGETTDGGLRRLPRLLEKHRPEVVVIELGGNDGLRGFPPDVIESNLADMVEQVKSAGAIPLLIGMKMPPNYGRSYNQAFTRVYQSVSDKYGATLVPFFLEGIYNREGMMQGDGIHPTEQAQPLLLDNIWPRLEPLLRQASYQAAFP